MSIEKIQKALDKHVQQIESLFKAGMLVTIVIRHPTNTECELVASSDEDFESVKDALDRALDFGDLPEEPAPKKKRRKK